VTSKNDDDTRLSLEQIDKSRKSSAVSGYALPGGQPQAVPGDEDAPFVKSPPFPESPVVWVPPTALAATYTISSPVDVEDWRLLKVYIEMLWPANSNSQIAMLPETLGPQQLGATSLSQQEWYSAGVVDPTITYLQPNGFGNNYGARTFSQSMLVSPVLAAGAATRAARFTLVFDVSDATQFRLQLAQLTQGQASATFALAYQRST